MSESIILFLMNHPAEVQVANEAIELAVYVLAYCILITFMYRIVRDKRSDGHSLFSLFVLSALTIVIAHAAASIISMWIQRWF